MNTSHEFYTEGSGQVLKMMVVIKGQACGQGELLLVSLSCVCVRDTLLRGVDLGTTGLELGEIISATL